MLGPRLGDAGDNTVTATELVPPLTATLVYQRINKPKLFSNNGNVGHGGGARGAKREASVMGWGGIVEGPPEART